jgi:hypothetical protein
LQTASATTSSIVGAASSDDQRCDYSRISQEGRCRTRSASIVIQRNGEQQGRGMTFAIHVRGMDVGDRRDRGEPRFAQRGEPPQ